MLADLIPPLILVTIMNMVYMYKIPTFTLYSHEFVASYTPWGK